MLSVMTKHNHKHTFEKLLMGNNRNVTGCFPQTPTLPHFGELQ